MKTKLKRLFTLVLCLCIAATILTACGGENKLQNEVKARISTLEAACQRADINAVIDCVDPQVVGPIKSALEFWGMDTESLSGAAYTMLGLGAIADELQQTSTVEDLMDCLGSLKITPTSYSFNDEKDACEVAVTVSIEADGEKQSEDGTLSFVLRDGEWYLQTK